MKFFRKSVLLLFVFSLLSGGQAYPLSLQMTQGKKPLCCCSPTPKVCDCKHTGKGKAVKGCHTHASSKKKSTVAKIPCGNKGNSSPHYFQFDPTLPSPIADMRVFTRDDSFASFPSTLSSLTLKPIPPPPKA